MRFIPKIILAALAESVTSGRSRGEVNTPQISLVWRFGEKRIEDKARENVFSIHSVHMPVALQRRGHMTEILQHLAEYPELGGRRIDWIYFEQVNFRFARHLEQTLLYQSDFGVVIDCWRNVTGQLELKL